MHALDVDVNQEPTKSGNTTYRTPFLLAILAIYSFACARTLLAETDNGVPISKAEEFRQKYSPKTSSDWRTYQNSKTGGSVSFNPKTSELWFNPVTKKYEAVLREDGSPDPKENFVKKTGPKSNYQKTEKWFNPVTKKYETVLTETGPDIVGKTAVIQYPQSLDNGLPAKTAKNWDPISDGSTSASWKTYKNNKTGEVVSFNPRTSELWFNPVKEKWEPVARESVEQKQYLKDVARQLAEKDRPKNATGWRCNYTGTVHSSPDDCDDPDQGGQWVSR